MPSYVIKVGSRYVVNPRTIKPTVTLDIAEASRYPRSEAYTIAGALQGRGLRTCVIEVK